jgi:phage shock protein PspC (stress-responsive transcriptional regulator)/predicted membrane protein
MSDATPPPPPPPESPEQPTTQAPQPEPPRRLLRSRDERVIGGVCGGLARYFNVDPLIFRIAAVALVFVGGFAIVAYLAALLLVPDDDGTGHPVPGKPGRVATIAGAVAIVLAGILLIDGDWGVGSGWVLGALVPTAIVVAVLAVAGQRLLATRGENRPAAGRIVGAALIVLAILVGTVVLAAGAAVATAAGGGTIVAIVVIALGLAMVGLSFQHRRARWLVVPALAIAIPAGVVQAAGIDTDHGVGERNYDPATIADLKPAYELGVGELDIDLRHMTWDRGETVRLKVDVGIGHSLILVPEDTCVQAGANAGLGWIQVLGEDSGGADVDDQRGTVSRYSGRKLILDGKVGMGAIEVRHSPVRHDDGPPWHDDREDVEATISDALADAGCAGERA